MTPEQARDLAHDFFADILSTQRFTHLDREKGKFRSYLLGALKHFLSRQRARASARKRGGGAESLSLNETGAEARLAPSLDDGTLPGPEAEFDRKWTLTILARALGKVEAEWLEAGKAGEFESLSPWLTGEAQHGDQAELAESLGLPPNTLKSTLHRLRRRFRHAVKEEIRDTLADPGDLDQEMASLFASLSGN